MSGNRLSSRVISLMAQELPYYPSSIYTLILFVLPLSALGDTPDYIIGGLRDGRPWGGPGRGLTGKGFSLEREGNGVCRLHSSIKKTYLKLHLLN